MRFSLFALFVSTALVGVVSSSPTPEVNEYEARDLEPRVSLTNMVRINSAKDYCLIVPKNKRTNIGDSEHPGGMTTYCSKPQGGQGKLPSNFWKNVAYKKGKGKTGKAYVQLTGCINAKSLDRLDPSDGGGQYDSSGGAGGKGNPKGSKCTGYAHYVELIEPDVNRACIRCCQEYKDCPLNKDTAGCPAVIPGNYFSCT
ncbi:hypothetical protein FRC03_003241 [Tulasnella sp. 419]|nr:hypothetical protein FRC03_003241 [Tulasnella sp. 419]